MDSKYASESPLSQPSASARQSPWTIILGIGLILMPLIQLFLALRPWWAISDFLPLGTIIEELGKAALMTHAAFIAGVLMMIGGLLLLLRSPWGWTLGITSIGFTLFWSIESLCFGAVMLFKEGAPSPQMVDMIFEILAMTYYAPVLFFIVNLLGLVYLLQKTQIAALRIARAHKLTAWGIAIFLFLDLHLTLLFYYLQSA